MAGKIRKHVYISGRVQGVGFRAFTTRTAHSLGVAGWVKNLADGRVEAIFSGSQEQVDKILEEVKEGPSFANVEDIEIIDENYKGQYDGFEVRY
ncbi:acylphosphatase [Halanaerobacter jeridensis]|uniref:Acylphosphatase n=1 Tax=Halanaerobacter jeridensis TaxID=706427 RepID=A0A939BP80_9FIRM|nr:acylphosphatase [Halanaerobacter jeridensis]MBM7556448.1 acylphosphatase [Halanaerobacter jeridensis]